MAILIYLLRDNGQHTHPTWRAASLKELFANTERYTGLIEEQERYNVHYTVADCHEGKIEVDGKLKSRQMIKQDYLPFDIDYCDDTTRIREIVGVICEVMKVAQERVLSMFSGHGVHVLIELSEPITDKSYFEKHKTAYKIACAQITGELFKRGIQGKADESVLGNARMLRVPRTINRKPGKPDVVTETINASSEPYAIDLNVMFQVDGEGYLPKDFMRKWPTPDAVAVLQGCGYLRDCEERASTLSEPEWYTEVGIIARLPNGPSLVHERSRKHPAYSLEATEAKIKQAVLASGPATCERIAKTYEACAKCPHYGKVTSPIQIAGQEHIATEKMGFHHPGEKLGKPGRPDVEGLRRYFERHNAYKVIDGSDHVYSYNGKYWEPVTSTRLNEFSYKNFNPKPVSSITKEFIKAIESTNIASKGWLDETVERKVNFPNGVLDLETKKFLPHSPDFGFTGILPYDYDPEAKAPMFEVFLDQVLMGDQELKNLILEFMGYSISGQKNRLHKALILLGDGANGKSTLLELWSSLLGPDFVSSVNLDELKNTQFKAMLIGKYVNISEETPRRALLESSHFKDMVSGKQITSKSIWEKPVTRPCRAKFVFACNELPPASDATDGFSRRLLIIPFKFTVKEKDMDIHLDEKLLNERSGILNMCLDAYDRLVKQNGFSESVAAKRELEEYMETVDDIKYFIDQNVEILPLDAPQTVKLSDLYTAYSDESKSSNKYPKAKDRFSKHLRKVIPAYEQRYFRPRESNGTRSIYLKGLRLSHTITHSYTVINGEKSW